MNQLRPHVLGPFRSSRAGFLAVLLAAAWFVPAPASAAPRLFSFADNRIAVELDSPRGDIPGPVLSALPIAMRAALEQVGPPPEAARLTIRLQEAPSGSRRVWNWFRPEPAAAQQDDDIRIQLDDDPLRLAFRLAHELAHWLVHKRHPVRPPLWLDEGLAQLAAEASAAACARTLKQDLDRPRPPGLEQNLFRLDELVALSAYPKSDDRAAAFYWQAEQLVRALRSRLGPAEFTAYLGLLAAPSAPAWDTPLRERWYFSDWDLNWLGEQILPAPAPASVP